MLPRSMRCPDPPGRCTWFRAEIGATKGPQDRMFEHARMHNHKFKAAFDYIPSRYGKVIKMFASFPSWENFVTGTLLKADPQNRHFYEIIPEGRPCKFYLDIEWEGPVDPGKVVLRHLVVELLAYVKVREGIFACKRKKRMLFRSERHLSIRLLSAFPSKMCCLNIP